MQMNNDGNDHRPARARATGRKGTSAKRINDGEGAHETSIQQDRTAVLAHELRNTAAPIRNAVQLLRLRASDPGLTSIADMIDRQVDEIVRIGNALADPDRSRRTAVAVEAGTMNRHSSSDVHGMSVSNETISGKTMSAAVQVAKRILIADDNAAVRVSLASMLQEMGHDVRSTADGAEAIELAQDWSPEVVLLDISMPHLNGFEVARRLRTKFPANVMKLVMMSGTSLNETTLRGAERAGFDHCIDKVNDFRILRQLLEGKN
jgi:CheY-like chemotaxis protein